jgi:hypothetical protein
LREIVRRLIADSTWRDGGHSALARPDAGWAPFDRDYRTWSSAVTGGSGAHQDSNPNHRTLDLFAQRPVPVRIPRIAQGQHQPSGPSDEILVELAAAGLSLRQIAVRVGLSHETVRARLGACFAVGVGGR